MKRFRSQRGSATLFVLIAVLFFSAVLLGIYNTNINKLRTQSRDIARIQKTYEEDADLVYQETMARFGN